MEIKKYVTNKRKVKIIKSCNTQTGFLAKAVKLEASSFKVVLDIFILLVCIK